MTDAAVPDEPEWRRLHPATLALALVRLGPRSLNMLPALAAIGIAGRWAYVLPALLLFLLASAAGGWLRWLRFRYAIGADGVAIESGLVARRHRTIPFDRIQDVSIEQGPVARLFGLAKVGFETGASGGDKKDEASLDAVSLAEAGRIRAAIRAHRAEAPGVPDEGAATDNAKTGSLLFAMPLRRLLLAGVFNFSLAALAVVGAAMQFVDNWLPFDAFEPADWIALARRYGLDNWVVLHRWVALVGGGLALILVGFGTGVATMLLANWNFRLVREARVLRRTRGLATRTDVAIPLHRVQAAIVVTGWLRRRWGWHELRLQSLASDSGKDRDHQVMPFGHLAEADRILAELAIARPDDAAVWHPSHVVIAWPGLLLALALGLGGAVAIASGQWTGWLALAAALPVAAIALIEVRHRGWSALPGQIAIRRGVRKPRLTLLPHASVQSADLRTGAVLRRFGLATLQLGVPGDSGFGVHRIAAIPYGDAIALRQAMLARPAAKRRQAA